MRKNVEHAVGISGMKLVALAAWALCAATAHAGQIDTDNPDLSVRWDNTVRVNGGWRVEGRNQAIANNPAFDESDYKFNRGDMITRRVDLLSELDIAFKGQYGARISATAWYDDAYNDTSVKGNPAYAALGTSYINQQYSNTTKRYTRGLSGEVLDAFVWGNFTPSDVPVNVKLGSFSTFWGNSVFFSGGIARGQQPIDGRKAVSSPGLEVKETFLPLTQINVVAQPTQSVSLTAQYYFDWANTRAADGGTYFGSSDFAIDGPNRTALGTVNLNHAAPLGPEKKRGDWGLSARFSPESFQGQNVAVYYRNYTEKTPWFFSVPNGGAPTEYRAVYARNAEMFGASFDGMAGPVSVGVEAGYHKNVGLASKSFAAVTEGARGDTWHALVNGIYSLPSSPIWHTGSLVGELSYTRLDKVTKNKALMAAMVGEAGCVNSATGKAGDAQDGCLTKDAWGIGVKFTPQYAAIFPGVDLDIPFTYQYGIKGNSVSALGVSEGVRTFSVGLNFRFNNVHLLDFTWADAKAPMRVAKTGLGAIATGGNGSYSLNDRGRVSVTYRTTF